MILQQKIQALQNRLLGGTRLCLRQAAKKRRLGVAKKVTYLARISPQGTAKEMDALTA